MNEAKLFLAGLALAAALMIPHRGMAAGPAPVDLGSAARFIILSGAAISSTGGGAIGGDVGASPIAGSAIGLATSQVSGVIYATDASGPAGSVVAPGLLAAAKDDLTAAYNAAAAVTPMPTGMFLNPGGGNLGGLNLPPGLYKFTSTALITGGNLTLSGGSNDVWIFQVGSALTMDPGMRVVLAGGAQARNIFWQVGTSATMGTSAIFKGTILADQSITMDAGSMLEGRALASIAAVTFNGGSISLPMPEAPRFTGIYKTNSVSMAVDIRTTPYFPLTLQISPSLTPTNWTTVARETPESGSWAFVDEGAWASVPHRFYRAFITAY